MARTDSLTNFLTDIANAIRSKKGTQEPIVASNFDTEIESIEANTKYAPQFITFTNFTGDDLTYETTNLDASNLTTMKNMFNGCKNVKSLDVSEWDTSNVTNMQGVFSGCNKVKILDVSKWDTSNVTYLVYMFQHCSSLTSLDLSSFDTSNITSLSTMFNGCNSLINLDLSSFDTTSVTTIDYMFAYCSSLTNLDLSNFDVGKVSYVSYLFVSCRNLKNFKSFENLGKGYTQKSNNYSSYALKVNDCSLLTHESLMSIINNLYDLNLTYDVANGETLYTQSLILGSTNLAKLTAEEIAIATNKGWNVS